MDRIYEDWDFQEACEDIGGKYDRNVHGEDQINICDVGDRSIVWHDYQDSSPNENNVFVWSNTNAPDEEHENEWSGNVRNLYQSKDGIVLEDAEGNPGPPGPMYVADATVTFGRYNTRAERTQQF